MDVVRNASIADSTDAAVAADVAIATDCATLAGKSANVITVVVDRDSRVDFCATTIDGIASARRSAGTIRNVLFIGKKSSGAARETGGNGRANAGEHLLTSDRAINLGAIRRRGFGVELDDLREDVLEVLEQLAPAGIFRRR